MKNIDVDIYVSNLISYFDKNPGDLYEVIGKNNKEIFFKKIKEQCHKNIENGEDIALTKNQFVKILTELKDDNSDFVVNVSNGIFQKTKFGDISLN